MTMSIPGLRYNSFGAGRNAVWDSGNFAIRTGAPIGAVWSKDLYGSDPRYMPAPSMGQEYVSTGARLSGLGTEPFQYPRNELQIRSGGFRPGFTRHDILSLNGLGAIPDFGLGSDSVVGIPYWVWAAAAVGAYLYWRN